MGELLTGVDPVAAFVPFCTCQNDLAWAGFWCAGSWELFAGFLSIPMRMGMWVFPLHLLPEVLAGVCWGSRMNE